MAMDCEQTSWAALLQPGMAQARQVMSNVGKMDGLMSRGVPLVRNGEGNKRTKNENHWQNRKLIAGYDTTASGWARG